MAAHNRIPALLNRWRFPPHESGTLMRHTLAPVALAVLLALGVYHAPVASQHTPYVRECTSHDEVGCLPESTYITYGE